MKPPKGLPMILAWAMKDVVEWPGRGFSYGLEERGPLLLEGLLQGFYKGLGIGFEGQV